MGIYLGGHEVVFTSAQVVESPTTNKIIRKTISGTYENSRVSTIGSYAFVNCSLLTEVNFPICTTIEQAAFRNCYSLASVNFPVCTSIGAQAFNNCSALITTNFSMCTLIGIYAFDSCYNLQIINFLSYVSISRYAFVNCDNLTTVYMPRCISIGESVFYNCCRLLSLYLTSVSQVPSLGNKAFDYTPINGYSSYVSGAYGSIFVPASLYNSFQTAENWSNFASRIVSV